MSGRERPGLKNHHNQNSNRPLHLHPSNLQACTPKLERPFFISEISAKCVGVHLHIPLNPKSLNGFSPQGEGATTRPNGTTEIRNAGKFFENKAWANENAPGGLVPKNLHKESAKYFCKFWALLRSKRRDSCQQKQPAGLEVGRRGVPFSWLSPESRDEKIRSFCLLSVLKQTSSSHQLQAGESLSLPQHYC